MNHFPPDERQASDSQSLENNPKVVYPNFSDDPLTAPTSRLSLYIYLIPIVGFFPALWTLYRRQASREQLAVSRLSVTLAATWLCSYLLLGFGAEAEFLTFRLLILNSFLTSGYFLVSVWLMFRLVRGKSARLPGFSRWAEQLGEHFR